MAGRELKITYGSFVVGGTGLPVRQITGIHKLTKNFTDGTFEFDFVIRKATEADFTTEVKAVEDAYRDPHQRLLVEIGSSTLLDINPTAGAAGNTGFNVLPEITKTGDENADTGRSRKYTIRFTYGLPADNVNPARDGGDNIVGLRDSTIDLEFDASNRRTLTISGTFTALTTRDARDQYLNQITAYETNVADALIGTNLWERIGRPRESEDFQNKTLEFTRIFRQILFKQAGAGNKDAANIVEQQLSIVRHRFDPGDSMLVAKRPIEYLVTYTANIDAEQQTDLRAEWENRIRSFIINQIRTTLKGGAVIVTDEQPNFDFDNNRITVNMTVLGFPTTLIERRVTIQDVLTTGAVLVPVWFGRLTKYEYQGPTSLRRTITDVSKLVTRVQDHALIDTGRHVSIAAPKGLDTFAWPVPAFRPLRGAHVHSEISSTPIFRWGVTPGSTKSATEITRIDIFEYYDRFVGELLPGLQAARGTPFFDV